VLLVALFVGFSSYSLACNAYHATPVSHSSHQSHSTSPHASPLCALAHSTMSVISVAPAPLPQAALLVAMAVVLLASIPSIPAHHARRSRAPPV
jgi:hypothetical protein